MSSVELNQEGSTVLSVLSAFMVPTSTHISPATEQPTLNKCCVQTLLAYRRCLEHGSHTTGPIAISPVPAEPCTKEFTATDLAKQVCVPTCDIDQVPLDTTVLQDCGVQKLFVTKESDPHVNTSFVNVYRADIGTQTVTPGNTSCGDQAIADTENHASQVTSSLAEKYRADSSSGHGGGD